MSLALADLASWLTTQLGDDTSAQVGENWMADTPDELIVLAMLPGGGGILFDGAFELAHVQVRCRAASDSTAEADAQLVHEAMKAAESSFQLGESTWVLTAEPTSEPAFFSRDVKQRTTYMASYQFTVAS